MFVRCDTCGYDSGDEPKEHSHDPISWLIWKIKLDGGDWEKGICPTCKEDGHLIED